MANVKKPSNLSNILGAARGNKPNEIIEETAPPKDNPAKTGNTAIGKSVNTETPNSANTATFPKRGTEKLVHITIEVPVSYRHHWKIESARNNRSFRDVAVEAFTNEFGLPKGE